MNGHVISLVKIDGLSPISKLIELFRKKNSAFAYDVSFFRAAEVRLICISIFQRCIYPMTSRQAIASAVEFGFQRLVMYQSLDLPTLGVFLFRLLIELLGWLLVLA